MKTRKTVSKKPLGRGILEWCCTILAAGLIAFPLKAFAFELVRVDGGSMDDTLANGEIMLVTKYDYATAWFSLPWQDPEAQAAAPRVTVGGDPQRFDIVICRYPGRGGTIFVKRVVGLPGDTVALWDGDLYVNGERQEEPYITDAYRRTVRGTGLTFGPYTVPDGHYFVMGDHRNNSNDSRAQGAIPRDMILGHVRGILFPFGSARPVE